MDDLYLQKKTDFSIDYCYACSNLYYISSKGDITMKLTETEWITMNVLWKRHPVRASEVLDQLPPGINWAYTTTKTILDRLVEKKAVARSKRGKISLFSPLLTRSQARKTAMQNLLNQAFDGAFGPMMHFLVDDETLTTKQRQELIDILASKRRK